MMDFLLFYYFSQLNIILELKQIPYFKFQGYLKVFDPPTPHCTILCTTQDQTIDDTLNEFSCVVLFTQRTSNQRITREDRISVYWRQKAAMQKCDRWKCRPADRDARSDRNTKHHNTNVCLLRVTPDGASTSMFSQPLSLMLNH